MAHPTAYSARSADSADPGNCVWPAEPAGQKTPRVAGITWVLGALLLAAALPLMAAPPPPGSDEAAALAAAGLRWQGGAHFREGCTTPFKPATERIDINRDGRDEIAVFLAPSRCFNETSGGNLALLMKTEGGQWVELLGFAPGVELVPVGGATLGFIDLGVANPGGCMGVFRWNGKAYAHALNRAIEPGGCQFR